MQAQDGADDDGGDGHRAAGEPGQTGLYFLGPLHELVAIGLHRPALDALCAGQRDGAEPPIDRTYLLKILDEEVTRQFGHPLRPLVELVLNAADASRASRSQVQVSVADGRVEVCDAGVGMGLRAILSRLLIPFATDKQPGLDLGRFGVGFFSVLGLGLTLPESFSLSVTTGDGVEGWAIRVVAWPIHAGEDVAPTGERTERASSLMCSVRRILPLLGTRVRVGSALLEAGMVRSYLRDALHFFPVDRALVVLDGVAINDGRLITGGQLFQEPIAAGAWPQGASAPASVPRASAPASVPLVARFHLGGRGLLASISAATFHAGVKVEACLAIGELALIDFPATVELTEGRDALKVGPELVAVAIAFHRRLIRLAVDSNADRAARDRLAEMAAQISALMLQSAGWEEVAREVARALLGPGRCMVGPERRESLLGFLGPSAAERLFVPESFWAEREWQAYLPGERDLLEDELEIDPPETLIALARRRTDLAGLAVLLSRAANAHTVTVALCRSRPPGGSSARGLGFGGVADASPTRATYTPHALRAPRTSAARRVPGPLPCLGTRRLMLIREDSAAVRRPAGWSEWYALRAAFDRASGVRESDLERDLIVSEPLEVRAPEIARGPLSGWVMSDEPEEAPARAEARSTSKTSGGER